MFWLFLISGLTVMVTMLFSMLPLFGTDGLNVLLVLHRYAGLLAVVVFSIHVYCMLLQRAHLRSATRFRGPVWHARLATLPGEAWGDAHGNACPRSGSTGTMPRASRVTCRGNRAVRSRVPSGWSVTSGDHLPMVPPAFFSQFALYRSSSPLQISKNGRFHAGGGWHYPMIRMQCDSGIVWRNSCRQRCLTHVV